ncbi:HAD family hydrolase [Candidatus Curtissbacteria bacterium]|nr:HAD family hydrolase [Candidatus Curtissbacteria bacterium]
MIGGISDRKEKDLSGIKFVISDWDGTLVDSMPANTECFLEVMAEIGGDPGELRNYYLSSAGSALTKQIKEAAKKFANKNIEDTRELEAKFFDYYLQMGEIRVLEGAFEALKFLKENGFKVVVWSSQRTDIIAKKLEQTGFGEFVDFYIGAVPGDDLKVKGPFLIEEIAKHFQIPVEQLKRQSIVIGDGVADIVAGQNSGAKTVGLGSQGPRLQEAGADYVIRDIGLLPDLLR